MGRPACFPLPALPCPASCGPGSGVHQAPPSPPLPGPRPAAPFLVQTRQAGKPWLVGHINSPSALESKVLSDAQLSSSRPGEPVSWQSCVAATGPSGPWHLKYLSLGPSQKMHAGPRPCHCPPRPHLLAPCPMRRNPPTPEYLLPSAQKPQSCLPSWCRPGPGPPKPQGGLRWMFLREPGHSLPAGRRRGCWSSHGDPQCWEGQQGGG